VAAGFAILIIPNEHESRLQSPVSIYRVEPDSFSMTEKDQSGTTWHSFLHVSVLEENRYPSVADAIFALRGAIRFIR
jgi:hypothetical protein